MSGAAGPSSSPEEAGESAISSPTAGPRPSRASSDAASALTSARDRLPRCPPGKGYRLPMIRSPTVKARGSRHVCGLAGELPCEHGARRSGSRRLGRSSATLRAAAEKSVPRVSASAPSRPVASDAVRCRAIQPSPATARRRPAHPRRSAAASSRPGAVRPAARGEEIGPARSCAAPLTPADSGAPAAQRLGHRGSASAGLRRDPALRQSSAVTGYAEELAGQRQQPQLRLGRISAKLGAPCRSAARRPIPWSSASGPGPSRRRSPQPSPPIRPRRSARRGSSRRFPDQIAAIRSDRSRRTGLRRCRRSATCRRRQRSATGGGPRRRARSGPAADGAGIRRPCVRRDREPTRLPGSPLRARPLRFAESSAAAARDARAPARQPGRMRARASP